MDRNIQRIGLVNWIVLLGIGLANAGFATQYSGSVAAQAGAIFLLLAFLVALVSYFQMRLESREESERLEFEELSKAKDASALFDRDTDSFDARRSREQFEKWFVPAFTIILLLIELGALYFINKLFADPFPIAKERALVTVATYAVFFLALFLLGKYSASLARLEKQRLIRPGGSFMLLSAFICLFSGISSVGAFMGFAGLDAVLGRIFWGILGLLALETLGALLFEIYRPRLKGQQARLIYDSRLVGLLGQPGGIFTTVAHTIDYQFGFKVSETWFYRFLERAFVWIVLLQLGVLFLSTSVVVVEPHESALIERFGKPVRENGVMGPGLHFKLPWPIEKTHRFHPDKIQIINVGFKPHEDREADRVQVWTKSHYEEEYNLLVASHDQETVQGQDGAGATQRVPVNLLTASIPVHFVIDDLAAWAYGYVDGYETLKALASRETIKYFVSVDVDEIMSVNRKQAARDLRDRIQTVADEAALGVDITFVGLQDIHPPIGNEDFSVAQAFEKVNSAIQEKERNILKAEEYRAGAVLNAYARAASRLSQAHSYHTAAEQHASSISARFESQLGAFRASPTVFTARAHLNTIARAAQGARKYVIGVTNTHDVITLNLEDKIRQDLLDLPVEPEYEVKGREEKR